MTDPKSARARDLQKLTEDSIGGWILVEHKDGADNRGMRIYWHGWRHQARREAIQ